MVLHSIQEEVGSGHVGRGIVDQRVHRVCAALAHQLKSWNTSIYITENTLASGENFNGEITRYASFQHGLPTY